MSDLIKRLKEAAEQMRRGVYSPGHLAAIEEAIKRLELCERRRKMFDTTNWPCHWNDDVVCYSGQMCDGCEHQPAPEDKKNGKAPPVPLKWEPDYTGRGMGFPICPACGDMPYSTERCIFCGQLFIQDERTKAYNEPPDVERHNCFACGGQGTIVGARTKANGHFHGVCEICGCRVLE